MNNLKCGLSWTLVPISESESDSLKGEQRLGTILEKDQVGQVFLGWT